MATTESGIAIAGAGIGGLALAVALSQSGRRVTVFERASELRLGGGALILWCNALKTLDAIGLRGALLDAPSSQPVEGAEYRRLNGEYLTNMPVGDMSRRHGAESVVLARRDLLDTLYGKARETAEIRFGAGVVGFTERAEGVSVSLSDGSERVFDALVGADGIHSTVRSALGLHQPLRDLRQDLWVATTRLRPPSLEPGVTIASLGAGFRFWHALLGDEQTFWYATLRTDDGARPPSNLAELERYYAGWHDPIPELIHATLEKDALHTAMRDRAPRLPWGRGRVTLLGDAAHAVTPDLGQGACQAIESAVVLARCLDGADVARGLREYERRRFARTAEVNRISFLAATTSAVASPLLCAARDAAMRVGLRATAVTQLDWLFRGPL